MTMSGAVRTRATDRKAAVGTAIRHHLVSRSHSASSPWTRRRRGSRRSARPGTGADLLPYGQSMNCWYSAVSGDRDRRGVLQRRGCVVARGPAVARRGHPAAKVQTVRRWPRTRGGCGRRLRALPRILEQLGEGAYIPAKASARAGADVAPRGSTRTKAASGRLPGRGRTPGPWRGSGRLGGAIDLVLAGGSGRTLAFGPGHLRASAMPEHSGNTVIAGHRDTHFNFLQRLAVGEPLAVETVDGESHLYQVIDIDVVDSRRSSLLLDTEESMLSLVTCYPFDALLSRAGRCVTWSLRGCFSERRDAAGWQRH